MDLAKEFDAYEFMDQVENPEDALTEIKYNLLAGNGMLEYAAFLKDVKEESRELAPKAEALLGKLKEYSPELTEGIQPMVKIQFSQDLEFKEGSMIPLAEADERLRAADERQAGAKRRTEAKGQAEAREQTEAKRREIPSYMPGGGSHPGRRAVRSQPEQRRQKPGHRDSRPGGQPRRRDSRHDAGAESGSGSPDRSDRQ